MRTGASRLERSFLCTQRKLISVLLRTLERTRSAMGTPEMKATSLRDLVARTPTCHSLRQPGDLSALIKLEEVCGHA